MNIRNATLQELATYANCHLIAEDKSVVINGLNLCNRSSLHDSIISYITSPRYLASALDNMAVKALFTTKDVFNEINTSNQLKIRFIHGGGYSLATILK